jgi:hypothetical protein
MMSDSGLIFHEFKEEPYPEVRDKQWTGEWGFEQEDLEMAKSFTLNWMFFLPPLGQGAPYDREEIWKKVQPPSQLAILRVMKHWRETGVIAQ